MKLTVMELVYIYESQGLIKIWSVVIDKNVNGFALP